MMKTEKRQKSHFLTEIPFSEEVKCWSVTSGHSIGEVQRLTSGKIKRLAFINLIASSAMEMAVLVLEGRNKEVTLRDI